MLRQILLISALALTNYKALAAYDYNFPVSLETYPEVKVLDVGLIKKSDIRSTLLSATGQTDLLGESFKKPITQQLLKITPVNALIGKQGVTFDGHLFTKTALSHARIAEGQEKYDEIYTSSNCGEVEMESKIRKVNEKFYLVQKNFSGCGKKAEVIYTYEFYKKVKSKPSPELQNYLYLADAEYQNPYHWKKPAVEFAVVGDEAFFLMVSETLKIYQNVLKDKLNISFVKKESCDWASPEQHCIILFDSKQKKEDSSIHFAATNVAANPSSGEIVDADILLRKTDYEKWKENLKLMIDEQIKKTPDSKAKLELFFNTKSLQYLVNIITHEFGHALGLAHNFSDKNKSIMGYNQLVDLADYDYDALNALYRLKNKKRQSSAYELLKTPVQ